MKSANNISLRCNLKPFSKRNECPGTSTVSFAFLLPKLLFIVPFEVTMYIPVRKTVKLNTLWSRRDPVLFVAVRLVWKHMRYIETYSTSSVFVSLVFISSCIFRIFVWVFTVLIEQWLWHEDSSSNSPHTLTWSVCGILSRGPTFSCLWPM